MLIFYCLEVHVSLPVAVNPTAISVRGFALCLSVFVHPGFV